MAPSAGSITDTSKSWRRLLVALTIAIVANIGIWAFVVIMPSIEAEFGTPRSQTAFPYTMTMIGFGIGNVLLGRVLDKFGITRALIGGSLLIGFSFFAAASLHDIYFLAAVHFCLGIGTSVGFGPLIADVSHWFSRNRGIAVAIIASGNYLSGVVWPVFISDMLADNTWRDIYLLLGIMVPSLTIPLSFAMNDRLVVPNASPSNELAKQRTTTKHLSGQNLQWLLGLAGICCCVAMSMPQVHMVSYCVGLGYGPAIGAELLSIMLAFGVMSRLIFGLVSDKLGGIRTVLISSFLQMLSLLFFLPFDSPISLYIVSAIFGLAQGGIVPSYAIVVREFLPASEAGERIGLVLMMTVFGMALGGWMSGAVFDMTGSYQLAFLNGVLWNLFNLVIMGWLLIRTRNL
jgi:MFS family permease